MPRIQEGAGTLFQDGCCFKDVVLHFLEAFSQRGSAMTSLKEIVTLYHNIMYLETPMNSLGALFETIDEKTGDVWGSCDEGGIQSLAVSVKKG